jgi:Protein of Unknown function (DUF2784)
VAYRVLADLVLAVHVAFVAFAIAGGLLALRWRWLPWLHVPAVLWGAVVEFTGWVCPLTPLENWLRRAGGSTGYSGTFIDHYVSPVLYSTTLTRDDQILYGFGLLLINLFAYGLVLRRIGRGVERSRAE